MRRLFSPTTRVSRGLHRIGIVLAVPLIAFAAFLFFKEARKALPLPECAGMFDDLAPNAKPCRPKGVPENPFAKYTLGRQPDYEAAGLTVLAGFAIYGTCRALGWVIDGFAAR